MAEQFSFQEQNDIGPRMQQLAARKELLGALQQAAMRGSYKNNRTAVAELAANLGTTWLAQSALKDDRAEQVKLHTEMKDDLRKSVDYYGKVREGKSGALSDAQAYDLMNNDQLPAGGMPEYVKADPKAALLHAMSSQHPELQAIGKMDMQAQLAKGKEKGFKDHMTADGSIVRVYDDGRKPEALGNYAKPKDQWSEPYAIQGVDGKPLMVKRNLATNEVDVVDKAPKITANATANSSSIVPKGETEFSKQLGKDVAGEYKEARDAAQGAYKARAFVGQMQELEKSGIFTGPTANIATTLGAVGQTLGLPVDEAKLANSQAFQQQFAAQVANVLTSGGGIGRSMTDADRKAFEQSLPTMLMSPQGRAQVYRMIESQAGRDISRAESFQKQLTNNPVYGESAGLLTLNPVDNAPMRSGPGGVLPPGAAPVTPPTGGKPRVSNW